MLSPALAALMADGVYGVMYQPNVARALRERGTTSAPMTQTASTLVDGFELNTTAVEGASGNLCYGSRSGFGMVLTGKGRRQGEVAVVCRGTQLTEDWLSNINAAMDIGPAGLPVHAGFNRIYATMRAGVHDLLRGTNPHTIHVVGHSLGGAIANLFAADFAGDRRADVKLYTFGAPRPGVGFFSDQLSQVLGTDRVFRVYSMADPVPMVPIFPFRHAPRNPGGIRVAAGGQGISVNAHLMGSYGPAMEGGSWDGLLTASTHVADHKSVDYWLARANATLPFSGIALWALGKALNGILDAADIVLGTAITGLATAIDGWAFLLQNAAAVTRKVGTMLESFIRAVFRFLGRTAEVGVSLTESFIRYVLMLLWQSVTTFARLALNGVNRRMV